MDTDSLITELFAAIDAKNTDDFSSFLHPKCRFRFGNVPAVTGLKEVATFVTQFFESIHAINHEVRECWEVPDGIICHGCVTYTRHDKTTLSVPFCNVLKISEDKISDYLIFADTSLLYSNS